MDNLFSNTFHQQITRRIAQRTETVRDQLKQIVNNEYRKYGGGIALDCWTDKAKKITYFGVTVHFFSNVDGHLVLNDRVLAIRQLAETKKTGEYLKREISKFLDEVGLQDLMKEKIIFVSDRGTNMVSLMNSLLNLHCMAHMLNNTVGKLFAKDRSLAESQQIWVYRIIVAVTAIVKFFKASGLNSLFTPSLKSNICTRWNTVHAMVDSVIIHYEKISQILRGERKHLNELNAFTLDELILLRAFLKPFKTATDQLEATKQPTLCLVYPNYFKILEHLQTVPSDPPCIIECKQICLKYWTENVRKHINNYHGVALFLHPLTKSLRMQMSEEKKRIYEQTTQMMVSYMPLPSVDVDINLIATTNPIQSPEMENNVCLDRETDEEEEEEQVRSPIEIEIFEYKSVKTRGLGAYEKFDLMGWWESNKERFPRLYGVARLIHAIPASSAAAERLFSIAGRLVSFRPNMRSNLVDELLFLRSNTDVMATETQKSNTLEEIGNENIVEEDDENGSYEVEEVLFDLQCGL